MKPVGLFLLILTAGAMLHAQNPPLAFEVASVKPNNSRPSGPGDRALGCNGTDSHSPGMTIPRGRCVSRFEPLRLVIALAYDVPPASMYPYQGQVLSGPDWMNSEIYDIEAKADVPATQAELKQMLRALLEERFKLKLHRESRELPVYALVTTKNGPKLESAPKDRECGEQRRRDHRYELGATSLSGHCHAFVPGGRDVMIQGQSVDMSDFAEMLSIWAGRIVVDKTGIQGRFDIKLPRFGSGQPAPQPIERNPNPNAVPGGEEIRAKIADAPALPTLFTVLDRLGLKLESSKGPVEVLVIDSLERPSEN
jgi:uncharacterized protein (TIGR03435 family)